MNPRLCRMTTHCFALCYHVTWMGSRCINEQNQNEADRRCNPMSNHAVVLAWPCARRRPACSPCQAAWLSPAVPFLTMWSSSQGHVEPREQPRTNVDACGTLIQHMDESNINTLSDFGHVTGMCLGMWPQSTPRHRMLMDSSSHIIYVTAAWSVHCTWLSGFSACDTQT